MNNSIERLRPGRTGAFRYAVLDFDGTLSLIRQGWQEIMTPYFTDELCAFTGLEVIPTYPCPCSMHQI